MKRYLLAEGKLKYLFGELKLSRDKPFFSQKLLDLSEVDPAGAWLTRAMIVDAYYAVTGGGSLSDEMFDILDKLFPSTPHLRTKRHEI